ncbi:MAG: hypothetical protein AB8B93_09385 [Pseudomonadales bacterium]
MQWKDWLNAAVNLVIGLLLGLAVFYLGQLVTTGSWLLALSIVILSAGLWLFEGLLDRVMEKIFPSGIRPARSPKRRATPLPRRLSMPAGLVLGAALAWLGWSDKILGML